MADAWDAPLDDDEQGVAEQLDDDRLDDDGDALDRPHDPPDHALASLEATAPLDNGDLPLDSLEEREWREEPEVVPGPDQAFDLVDIGRDELGADGELLGEIADAGTLPPAEEAAIHVVDEPG